MVSEVSVAKGIYTDIMRLFIAIVSAVVVFASDLEPQGKLLASKNVENNFIVENRDLTIKYTIYNVGSSSALNVMLTDDSFPVTDFETVKGQMSVSWKSIPSNSNVTHIVTVKPLKSGMFNFTSAQITYQPTEESESLMAFTSAPGEGGIMSAIEFSRKHSPHVTEWAWFAVMCIPSLLIPFSLWYKSHSRYSFDTKSKKQ